MRLFFIRVITSLHNFNNGILLKLLASTLLLLMNLPEVIRKDVWRIFDQKTAIAGTRTVFFLVTIRLPWLAGADYFFNPAQYLNNESLAALKPLIEKSHLNEFEKNLNLALVNFALKEHYNCASNEPQSYQQALNHNLEYALSILNNDSSIFLAPSIKSKQAIKHFTIEDAKLALDDLKRLFINLDLNWFVISGTFLGAVRQKGFLGHDYDIDIGILEEDLEGKFSDKELLTALNTPEFSVKSNQKPAFLANDATAINNTTQPKYSLLIKLEHTSKIEIDLFIHCCWNEKVWHGSSIHLWHNSPFSTTSYEIEGRNVNGPKDYDLYLRENYGDNWREPVTNFNSSLDTPNGFASPTIQACIFFLKKIAQYKKANEDTVASGYLNLLISSGFIREEDGKYTFCL